MHMSMYLCIYLLLVACLRRNIPIYMVHEIITIALGRNVLISVTHGCLHDPFESGDSSVIYG